MEEGKRQGRVPWKPRRRGEEGCWSVGVQAQGRWGAWDGPASGRGGPTPGQGQEPEGRLLSRADHVPDCPGVYQGQGGVPCVLITEMTVEKSVSEPFLPHTQGQWSDPLPGIPAGLKQISS